MTSEDKKRNPNHFVFPPILTWSGVSIRKKKLNRCCSVTPSSDNSVSFIQTRRHLGTHLQSHLPHRGTTMQQRFDSRLRQMWAQIHTKLFQVHAALCECDDSLVGVVSTIQ